MSADPSSDPRGAPSASRSVLVLVNAGAGSVDPDRAEAVCLALESRGPGGADVRDPATDEEYAEAVASAAGREVVVVGGDGSVHRLLQQMTDQALGEQVAAVGVVPMGTGNDLARDAGVPLDWRQAVEVALAGRPVSRGLLVDDDGQVVINVAHCGVGAEATAHAAEVKGLLGAAAYVWGSVRAGLTSTGWHLRVVVDGETVAGGSERLLLVSVALGSSVGGGTLIAPQARHDDLVDVLVVRGTSLRARVGFARDLRRGRHTRRDDVTVVRGREITVEAVREDDAFRVNADGEVSPVPVQGRRWRLVENAWRLRVPEAKNG